MFIEIDDGFNGAHLFQGKLMFRIEFDDVNDKTLFLIEIMCALQGRPHFQIKINDFHS